VDAELEEEEFVVCESSLCDPDFVFVAGRVEHSVRFGEGGEGACFAEVVGEVVLEQGERFGEERFDDVVDLLRGESLGRGIDGAVLVVLVCGLELLKLGFGDDVELGVRHLETWAEDLWGALDIEEHAWFEFLCEERLVEEDEIEAAAFVVDDDDLKSSFASVSGDFEGADFSDCGADDSGFEVVESGAGADPFVSVREMGEELSKICGAERLEFPRGEGCHAGELSDGCGEGA
tara:strand:- start:87486 stop:88187 length:702 start_codon:yes stop_codon:yes gene_type:complete